MAKDSLAGEPINYMTVPEKIELTGNSGAMGYSLVSHPPHDHLYKPMKIPDTITLETTGPPISGGASNDVGGGGKGGVNEGMGRLNEVRRAEDTRNLQPKAEDTARERHIPKVSSVGNEDYSASQNTTDPMLEHRVRTLENKVQRLTETVLSHQRNASGTTSNRGNGFWYVVTFAGWMMVPLIVAFMYQLKK